MSVGVVHPLRCLYTSNTDQFHCNFHIAFKTKPQEAVDFSMIICYDLTRGTGRASISVGEQLSNKSLEISKYSIRFIVGASFII